MINAIQLDANYIRVISLYSSRRCQGNPSTKASNCSLDSVNAGDGFVDVYWRDNSPGGRLEVWVDGNDAPLVTAGRHVRVQFEGWPALQFVGWPQAARGTFGGTVTLVDAHDDGTGRFRVLVTPEHEGAWPAPSVLRQGVRAHGFVLLEQVTVGYELWRRLNAFPPTLQAPPPADSSNAKAKK